MKYFRTTGIFFCIWCLASLLNGLLSGASLALLEGGSGYPGPGFVILSLVFSFLFSGPLVACVWFVTILAQMAGKDGDGIFQWTLNATFYCSITGALFFIFTLGTDFMTGRYAAGLSIVVSAMTAVLIFRKQIKANA